MSISSCSFPWFHSLLSSASTINDTYLSAARNTYNIYLHPLRKFPGPRLFAAYRLPFVYYNIKGVLPFKVKEFHARYGPIVRITPNELAFTSPEAWQDIYGMQPGRIQNQKDLFSLPVMDPGMEPEIVISDDVNHARFRRIYGPAFTTKALEEQQGMLMKYATRLMSELKFNVTKNPVQDMTAWYNFVTFDLTGDFAFGESFHSLESDEYRSFVKTIFDGIRLGLAMNQIQRYGLWTVLRQFLLKSAYKARDDMINYTKDLVDRRLQRGYDEGRTDVFNYLLRDKGDQEMTKGELYNNAQTLVIAGSETTATLLSGVTWHLLKNPEKLAKVKHEVRSTFNDDSEIDSKSVLKLPYMLAMLQEGLRIFPPSPFGFPQRIMSKGGQTVARHWVPKNVSKELFLNSYMHQPDNCQQTLCAIFFLAASYSTENWAQPEEFLPERWMSDGNDEFTNDKREASQPFSFGPRNCTGKK
jgi:cytochrome P450